MTLKMRFSLGLLVAASSCLLPPVLSSQITETKAPVDRLLVVAETREIPGAFTNPIYPAKCGPDGSSIYVRQFLPDLNMPATRINADGKGVRIFGLGLTRYNGHARIWDFAPARDGGVYLLIQYTFEDGKKPTRSYRVLSFDSDGRLSRDAAIEGLPFDPLQVAAFGDGSLVVAGRKTSERGGHKGAPGIAIISDTGRLLKTLKIEHDVEEPKSRSGEAGPSAKRNQPETDEPSKEEKAQEQYDFAIDLSVAQSADDGKVYVLRQAPEGPLFQISPGGTIREIKLPGYQGGKINAAMVARGRLLLHYVKDEELGQTDMGLYSQYDLAAMEKIQDYAVEKATSLSNAMQACYNGDQLTFLKIRPRGHLFVLVAKFQ